MRDQRDIDKIEQLKEELAALKAKYEGATYALRLVKSYGSGGEREDGVSVSYYVDKALTESEEE